MSAVIAEEYMSSLRELTCNSRPHISMLTMLAEDNHSDAISIVNTIETHLNLTQGDRLPTLYLIDSIVKNIGRDYVALFSRKLPTLFAAVFEKANEKMRSNMYKLRTTWDGIFPVEKLAILDTLVNDLDPRWPVVRPPQPTNIHINPEFFKGGSDRRAAVKSDIMRERILKEQKVLLELQKKKVELEILQTKEVLEKKEKNLESITTTIRGENKPPALADHVTVQSKKESPQPHSSNLKDVESENSKKLLEVSLKDPRRKSRQVDRASDSPLSGTSSPTPPRHSKHPYVSSSSPLRSHTDDNRDRPPKKKHKSKDKKRHHGGDKDKESIRESKKAYTPKLREGGTKNNGHSYKTSNSERHDGVEMMLDDPKVFLAETDDGSRNSSDIPMSLSRHGQVSGETRSTIDVSSIASERLEAQSIDLFTSYPVDKLVTDSPLKVTAVSNKSNVEAVTSQIDTGKPTVPSVRPLDPRTSKDSSNKPTAVAVDKQLLELTEALMKESSLDSGNLATSSSLLTGLSEKAPTKLPKSLDIIEPFEDMGGTDSVSDLISTLSSLDENEAKFETDMVDISSHDSSLSATRSSGEAPSSFSVEDTKSDSTSLSDVNSPVNSTKVGAPKRKVDAEEDREDHKKIILSEPQGSEGSSEGLLLAVSSIIHSPKMIEQPSSVEPPSVDIPIPPSEIPVPTDELPNNTIRDSESDTSRTPIDLPVQQAESSATLPLLEETGKDVDLRLLLPRPVERTQTQNTTEEVKEDKKEVDTITLFGGEDVDYRQKPPPQQEFNLPSPPPPPVIGNLQEATGKKSWAQIKDKRSEERSSPKVKPTRLKRPSLSQQPKQDVDVKESSLASSQARCNLLIKEAEEQLRNGNITFVEYNKMLQEVVTIREERFLKEARARYSKTVTTPEEEKKLSPLPCDNSFDNSFESDRSEHPEQVDRTRTDHFDNRMEPPPPAPRLGAAGVHMMQTQLPPEAPEPFSRDRFDFSEKMVWEDRVPPPSVVERVVERFHRPVGPPIQPPFPPFPTNSMPFHPGYRPRMPRNAFPTTFLPPANMDIVMESDTDSKISIGDSVKQVRFYGMTAVVLLACDNPREICFPPGQRRLMVDKRHEFQLQFGSPPIEIIIDDVMSLVHLGVPSRELYIDNKYYSMQFGGMPIEAMLCGRIRSICLFGPPPIVRYSPMKCTHLVAGTVNLYINAKSKLLFFLDGKPQTFHIEGQPCVLKFADSLITVLINGVPVPLEFGGCPVPVMLRGVQHFLRLSALPPGIIPGQVSIMNMDSFAHPPMMLPPPIPMTMPDPTHPMFLPRGGMMPPLLVADQQPLDLLASVMDPPALTASEDRSYSIEQPPAPEEAAPQPVVASSNDTSKININDLFQKLLQTGLLHTTSTEPSEKKKVEEIDVDFSRPETLKLARPSLVSKLYSGIQCSSCGIRFPPEGTKMYSRHLDWHFRQNRREKHSTRKPQSRRWYYDLSDWIQYQELEDIDDTEPEPTEEEGKGDGEDDLEDIPSVPVGHRKDVMCQVCGERFEEFFNHETEEWHARNAILVEDLFYHPLCYEEFKLKKESGVTETDDKMEEEEPPPVDEPATVEVIDLDDTDTAVPSPVSSVTETVPLLGPDKVDSPEIIAVDDNSDTKSEDVQLQPDQDLPQQAVESDDDDILGIEVIERKIESYELLDDEEEEKPAEEGDNNKEEEDDDKDEEKEEFDYTKVTVKQEKDRDRFIVESVDSSLPTYTATIDGNIVHETAAPLVVPGRIKINIHRSAKSSTGDTDIIEPSNDSNEALVMSQPPPPGEDSIEPPQSVKTKLMGVEFSPQPTVNQGSELSGLCSIM